MSHLFSPFCTLCAKDGIRTDLAPHEGVRSKGWAYCKPCYIRRFPQAAKKRGWIQEVPPQPKKVVKPVKPVQMTLFEVGSAPDICGCQG